MCWKVGTPWIDGGIQEINGVAKVFVPSGGPCYECGMNQTDYQLIQLRYSCPLLKQDDILQGRVPTSPTIASIIGGLQVQEALKLIHDLPAATGAALVFNGAANRFYQTQFPVREDCLSHETYDAPLAMPLSARNVTASQLFEAIHRESKSLALRVILDRDFLVNLECRACGVDIPVNQPLCRVGSRQGVCQQCQQVMQPHSVCSVATDSPLARRTLSELGIPDYDIVKVETEHDLIFVLLESDAPANRASSTPSD
jgi:adenylyltransferase/sulfurtransferase